MAGTASDRPRWEMARLDSFDAVLFDVFGTLVAYEPDRTALAYPKSHALVTGWGHDLPYERFLAEWDAASAALEVGSAQDHREFSMFDAALAFAARAGLDLDDERCASLGDRFVTEWQAHVRPVPGAVPFLERLATTHRIGVVSNTHHHDMVPSLLATMGVAELFDVVVLSVDHGHRKPHPSIYRTALDALGAAAVAFVGDSYDADYLGPTQAGMAAFLIDPDDRHGVPSGARLSSLLDLDQS
jgi:putative hydrolase of the HAD superfamily